MDVNTKFPPQIQHGADQLIGKQIFFIGLLTKKLQLCYQSLIRSLRLAKYSSYDINKILFYYIPTSYFVRKEYGGLLRSIHDYSTPNLRALGYFIYLASIKIKLLSPPSGRVQTMSSFYFCLLPLILGKDKQALNLFYT
jgi:hypothetical protein